jgi:hypothetical protein
MNRSIRQRHSIDSLFMILLFGIYILFLMLLLLFSIQTHKSAMQGVNENNGLRTSMAYLTTKVRQHDAADQVFLGEIDGLNALCLKDTIQDTDYITYIYLDDGYLCELFTSAKTEPVRALGTSLCELSQFEVEPVSYGLYHMELTDADGNSGELYLHPGVPGEGGSL